MALPHVIADRPDIQANFDALTSLAVFPERANPAPVANTALVYARDDGAGKTQLCVQFGTGAVQVLATEP